MYVWIVITGKIRLLTSLLIFQASKIHLTCWTTGVFMFIVHERKWQRKKCKSLNWLWKFFMVFVARQGQCNNFLFNNGHIFINLYMFCSIMSWWYQEILEQISLLTNDFSFQMLSPLSEVCAQCVFYSVCTALLDPLCFYAALQLWLMTLLSVIKPHKPSKFPFPFSIWAAFKNKPNRCEAFLLKDFCKYSQYETFYCHRHFHTSLKLHHSFVYIIILCFLFTLNSNLESTWYSDLISAFAEHLP